jgi:GTP-binding protein
VKVQKVEFCGSMADANAPLPGSLPQVAFSGRSNVGKSSLINVLLQRTRKKLAHVSGRPGKTQLLNFYRVNERFFLVDLPGFGFARAPKPVRDGWKKLVEDYLARPDGPRGAVHLLDIRHDPTEGDREMLEYLTRLGLPTLVVLTKVDKLTKTHRVRRMKAITGALNLDPEQVVEFSSLTGEGREDLLGAVELLVEEQGPPEGEAPPDGAAGGLPKERDAADLPTPADGEERQPADLPGTPGDDDGEGHPGMEGDGDGETRGS